MSTRHCALALAAAFIGLAAAPQAQAQIACWYDGEGASAGCDSCREGQGLSPPCDEGAGVCVVGASGVCRSGDTGDYSQYLVVDSPGDAPQTLGAFDSGEGEGELGDMIAGSTWAYTWRGTDFTFRFGLSGDIEVLDSWQGVRWYFRGGDVILDAGTAEMSLVFQDSYQSFTTTDWDGSPGSGRIVSR